MPTKADEKRRLGLKPSLRRVGDVRLPDDIYNRLVSLSVTADRPIVYLVRLAVMQALPLLEKAQATDRMALQVPPKGNER